MSYNEPVIIMVDSDDADDSNTRRSTFGRVAFLCNHVVKHACNLEQVIGLSSAENEDYVISVGSWSGAGLSLLQSRSVNTSVRITSDSPAARRYT